MFVYNFNPIKAFSDYGILTPPGEYRTVLSTDNPAYGGFGNIDETVSHFTIADPLYSPLGVEWLRLYLPPRTAMVLKLQRRRPGRPRTTAAKKETKPAKESSAPKNSKKK